MKLVDQQSTWDAEDAVARIEAIARAQQAVHDLEEQVTALRRTRKSLMEKLRTAKWKLAEAVRLAVAKGGKG